METTVENIGIRYLTPQTAKLFTGRLGSIHCVVDDRDAYANVYCQLCFPISHPASWIAVNYTDAENKEKEIGVIEDLGPFAPEMRDLVRASLGRQYFEQTVTRIFGVKWEFGLLFFDVEVNKERREFMMRWQQEKAIEYGSNGKVLLDVFDNRFVIVSVDELQKGDRDRLQRFIYW